ncbi:hypothetical protein QJS04_geneDACA011630 [Acorus gramineus]|uniref:G-patch domain-containing protein n=1 Tax=Acorus gramineus TaxID=55184 RepID=A0AAV9BYD6_ACOGR|nr:hypothetical protein QJS04_geneDACA011630 [Acorus gramineus]
MEQMGYHRGQGLGRYSQGTTDIIHNFIWPDHMGIGSLTVYDVYDWGPFYGITDWSLEEHFIRSTGSEQPASSQLTPIESQSESSSSVPPEEDIDSLIETLDQLFSESHEQLPGDSHELPEYYVEDPDSADEMPHSCSSGALGSKTL